jgi:hypothetical protein
MKKLGNWEQNLADFLDENANKPFEWGKWDCCIFSDSAVESMTGERVIPKSLKWKNEKDAKKTIKGYGGSTLLKATIKACKDKGLKTIEIPYVKKGDIVVYKEESYLLGISTGHNIVSPSGDGLSFKNNDLLIKAWRIPNG